MSRKGAVARLPRPALCRPELILHHWSRTLLAVLLILASGVLPGPAEAALRAPRPARDDDRTLYLLPITDGRPTAERVRSIVRRLGRGGPSLRVGFSGVFRYLADVDPARGFAIDTTRLEEIVAAARETRTPFLVHLNGGRWAGGGPLIERLARDHATLAWDQLDRPWLYLVDGEYHFSLSAYNERYREYKERNLKAAAAWLAEFAAGPDGSLLVGVSTDSEVLLNLHPYADYNPAALREFADYLSGEGAYGRGGRWQSDARDLSLRQLNERFGTQFQHWHEVRPPRENDASPWWDTWQSFRELLVDHSVQEQVDWIRQAGLPAERIFTHQSPALNPAVFGDTLATAQVNGGNLGVTLYGPQTVDADLLRKIRALSTTWGVLEYNLKDPNAEADLAALELLRSFGPRVVCPYHWDDLGGANEVGYTIAGTPLESALRTFVRRHRDEPLPNP